MEILSRYQLKENKKYIMKKILIDINLSNGVETISYINETIIFTLSWNQINMSRI